VGASKRLLRKALRRAGSTPAEPAQTIATRSADCDSVSEREPKRNCVSRGLPQRIMTRTIPIYIPLSLLLTLSIPALAQRRPSPYYEDTNNVPNSPEIHADRTVTVRLFAPKASEVVLMGSPGILEFTKKPVPLQKDEKGVWSTTIGPLPPGFYTYGFAIDGGLRMPDPANPDLEVRRYAVELSETIGRRVWKLKPHGAK